ncbi:hypothetical protein FDECE_11087 [Fusarium decemcellulare]|nr:hypothetical protein FDECE_11087 [Fusarium decemcellulare]
MKYTHYSAGSTPPGDNPGLAFAHSINQFVRNTVSGTTSSSSGILPNLGDILRDLPHHVSTSSHANVLIGGGQQINGDMVFVNGVKQATLSRIAVVLAGGSVLVGHSDTAIIANAIERRVKELIYLDHDPVIIKGIDPSLKGLKCEGTMMRGVQNWKEELSSSGTIIVIQKGKATICEPTSFDDEVADVFQLSCKDQYIKIPLRNLYQPLDSAVHCERSRNKAIFLHGFVQGLAAAKSLAYQSVGQQCKEDRYWSVVFALVNTARSKRKGNKCHRNLTVHGDSLYIAPMQDSPTAITNPKSTIATFSKNPSPDTIDRIINMESKAMNSHVQPYGCEHKNCNGSSFSSESTLGRHQKEVHADEGCKWSTPKKGFLWKTDRLDHMQRIHGYTGRNDLASKACKKQKKPVMDSGMGGDDAQLDVEASRGILKGLTVSKSQPEVSGSIPTGVWEIAPALWGVTLDVRMHIWLMAQEVVYKSYRHSEPGFEIVLLQIREGTRALIDITDLDDKSCGRCCLGTWAEPPPFPSPPCCSHLQPPTAILDSQRPVRVFRDRRGQLMHLITARGKAGHDVVKKILGPYQIITTAPQQQANFAIADSGGQDFWAQQSQSNLFLWGDPDWLGQQHKSTLVIDPRLFQQRDWSI